MLQNEEVTEQIYHLALREEWEDACASGIAYRRSTVGRSLEDEGFIHCSYEHQVQPTAAAFYRGRDDVVVLSIDTSMVDADIRVENGFPHIYGELPLTAVVNVREL